MKNSIKSKKLESKSHKIKSKFSEIMTDKNLSLPLDLSFSNAAPCKENTITSPSKLTPMMEQYIEIKAAHQDAFLFYRMGDFYELFFHDAVEAAQILGITLTKRGKHLGEDIPMCGVPAHSADDYLQKLIALGHRVAICEQTEDPKEAKKRGSKTVVQRDVIRIITPGTVTEEKLLDPSNSNYLVTIGFNQNEYALSWLDISTGTFGVGETKFDRLLIDIMRFEPKEVLIADCFFENKEWSNLLQTLGRLAVPQPKILFNAQAAEKRIMDYFKVGTLEGFATYNAAELSAISAAIAYIEKTQIAERPPLMRPQKEIAGSTLFIDAATRNNLELLRTLSGKREGSLIQAIDRTMTGAGRRLLMERLIAPLLIPHKIDERLDSIHYFLKNLEMLDITRDILRHAPDMTRALSRLAVDRGGPRDLAAIQNGLYVIQEMIESFETEIVSLELQEALSILKMIPQTLSIKLENALKEELPVLKREGNFIQKGFNQELDDLRKLRDDSRAILISMQEKYSIETGIKNLKIKYNNILGYFIEVTAGQAESLQNTNEAKGKFIHRQTMANAVRFTTTELASLETQIANAAERVLALELEIFENLRQDIVALAKNIQESANALAIFDVSSSLAFLAQEQNYCRPKIDDSLNFNIVEGRHPCVEQALSAHRSAQFIANDCTLGCSENKKAGDIWLLTGPNMGGKSTFLRQNALIAIMAQMGSFVPAAVAHIGVLDRLFSRVGASDDLARGHSTFMVEMVETATILNQATEKSLVILDEIGRGTATFDGLAIAWATLEHLHQINKCRTIFATHFHELTILTEKLSRLKNVTMAVKEWKEDVIFLYKTEKGTADRSYGIQVAKLAGLPAKVITRAQDVLKQLEQNYAQQKLEKFIDELPLLAPHTKEEHKENPLYEALWKKLNEIDPNDLTPKQALEALYQLKNIEENINNI